MALALGFTDAELLKLDEIPDFQGSHLNGFINNK
jgi:hypothetical protein